MTDGDGKSGIAPRSALADQTRIQQHDFPIGMQFGQAAGAGEPGHTGPDHRPWYPMGSIQWRAPAPLRQEFRPAMSIRRKMTFAQCHGLDHRMDFCFVVR